MEAPRPCPPRPYTGATGFTYDPALLMYFLYRFHPLFCIFTFLLFALPAQMPAGPPAPNGIHDWSRPVDFAAALRLAVAADPRFDLLGQENSAAAGRVEQASLKPNPVLGAEVENILGTGPVRGVEGLEITLGVSQVIERANKRVLRTALAEMEHSRLDWEAERVRADVHATVRHAFVAVLLAQQTVKLRNQQVDLAAASLTETRRLVAAARSPEVEETRARLAVARRRFALRQAERHEASSRSALAAIWGLVPAPGFTVAGEVSLESPVPELEALIASLSETVTLRRYEAERAIRGATLELERARATPDVELFGGARYFNEEDGDIGFLLGVSVPWPRNDRNEGNIRVAEARLRAVAHERAAARRDILIHLSEAWQALRSAHDDARGIESALIPTAIATLEETEAGYQRGQFTQLAVIESRRELFAVREAYLDALRRYAVAQADIEALTRPASL